MVYNIKDIKEAFLGSIVATLSFFLLRSGNSIHIDPRVGIGIGIVWLWITGTPFLTKNKETKIHLIGNIIVAIIVCSVMSLIFNMVTLNELLSFQFFSTAAWLSVLLAIPTAHFFDKMNIHNIYEQWYHKRRR